MNAGTTGIPSRVEGFHALAGSAASRLSPAESGKARCHGRKAVELHLRDDQRYYEGNARKGGLMHTLEELLAVLEMKQTLGLPLEEGACFGARDPALLRPENDLAEARPPAESSGDDS